jgi:hypothetical protein
MIAIAVGRGRTAKCSIQFVLARSFCHCSRGSFDEQRVRTDLKFAGVMMRSALLQREETNELHLQRLRLARCRVSTRPCNPVGRAHRFAKLMLRFHSLIVERDAQRTTLAVANA